MARIILSTLFIVSSFVHSAEEDKNPKKPFAWKPNQKLLARIQKRSYDFKEAGKEMEYALFVPSKYNKSKKCALAVALHGLGSNSHHMIRYPYLIEMGEKYGIIIVAPMGYNSRGWYGSIGKRARRRKGDPENLGELSEKDVMNVTGIVRKEFNVDENRIYLLGHSMGGGGTWHLALKYPDTWAGLAPIAPAIYRNPDVLEKIKHIPVILVQGEKDKLVPVKTARRWASKMEALKMNYKYIEVKNGDHLFPAFTQMPKIFEFLSKQEKVGEKESKKTS